MVKEAIICLSSRARIVLEDIASHDADGRTVRRAQALLWLDQGEPVQVVAQRLNASRQMVYDVVQRYESRLHLPVLERVQDSAHPGRPATKRDLVATEIAGLLAQPPALYGYRAQAWRPLISMKARSDSVGCCFNSSSTSPLRNRPRSR